MRISEIVREEVSGVDAALTLSLLLVSPMMVGLVVRLVVVHGDRCDDCDVEHAGVDV